MDVDLLPRLISSGPSVSLEKTVRQVSRPLLLIISVALVQPMPYRSNCDYCFQQILIYLVSYDEVDSLFGTIPSFHWDGVESFGMVFLRFTVGRPQVVSPFNGTSSTKVSGCNTS